MKERVKIAALAGLLYNLQRSTPVLEFLFSNLPSRLQERLTAEEDSLSIWTSFTYSLAVGGDVQDSSHQHDYLKPVLTGLELNHAAPDRPLWHKHTALEISTNATYPTEIRDEIPGFWDAFQAELASWRSACGDAWEVQDDEVFLTTLLSLLKKYLWCIPSPDAPANDISFYEHLRLSSALSACIAYDQPPGASVSPEQPIALLVRGDLSGIQKFIYRIGQPDSETQHQAKRLRGRSYYLTLLVDVLTRWLLMEIGMPPNCLLYAGGGRFDMLLPASVETTLTEKITSVEDWLLDQFQGELGLQTAWLPLKAADFADLSDSYAVVEDQLAQNKHTKWINHLHREDFFTPPAHTWHTCSVCRLTPLPDPGICPLCELHSQIGKNLPYTTHLWFTPESTQTGFTLDQTIHFQDSPFSTKVILLRGEADTARIPKGSPGTLVQINQTEDFIYPMIASSFQFLANEAPKAARRLSSRGIEPVDEGDVLHFEAIAALSEGAQRIGILKADADHLGLAISTSRSSDHQQTNQTLSRTASISSALDLFFAGHLNRICREFYQEWEAAADNPLKDSVEGLFYIVYAGGDDLFIIGPWNATLHLAEVIQKEFKAYTGNNSNLTISAGYVQVKPHFPIQKFAELVDEAEKTAKNAGRNRIHAFNQTLAWDGDPASCAQLLEFSNSLGAAVRRGDIPRSLVHDLARMQRQHGSQGPNGEASPMWTPRLFYTLARRLNKNTHEAFGTAILEVMGSGKVLFPTSIVSLMTRKE